MEKIYIVLVDYEMALVTENYDGALNFYQNRLKDSKGMKVMLAEVIK